MLIRIILALIFLTRCALAGGVVGYGDGIPLPPSLGFTPEQVFNISDFGARCDGVTNDDAAINRAFAAAAASGTYQSNNRVHITGPANARGCVVNSINGTLFTLGTGANTRPQVEISNLTLLCTGRGNICGDFLGSKLVKIHDVSIRGDTAPNSPEICLQFGGTSNTSAAWNSLERVNCNNEFSLTALYNVGSESNLYIDSMFANAHTTTGPIGSLGSITGGSGCVNGTYTATALIGGAGSGALATVVATGNAVTSVVVTYQGRDYAPSDVLSASVNGCSGFSVPVATISPSACIMDGQNYWRSTSAFVTQTLTPDAWISLTLDSFVNSHCRNLGAGNYAIWAAWTGGLHMYHSYLLNNSGANCMGLFDNGVTKGGIPGPNWGLDLDYTCEGSFLQSMINLTGSHASQVLSDFKYKGYHQGSVGMFTADSNVVSATIQNADIRLDFANSIPMFGNAKIWNVSSRSIWAPSFLNWNAPTTFSGQLGLGSTTATPAYGPLDIVGAAAIAVSCSRQLSQSYGGPLCQVQRTSDSSTMDLYPDGFGNLSPTGYQSFCAGTTCNVSVMYDQSGNANNFSQSTPSSQPALTLSVTGLGGRAAALFVDQGAQAMSATAAVSINDLWSSGGYLSAVINQTGSANQADRLFYKSNGGTVGWQLYCGFVGTSGVFSQGASTSGSTWQTSTLGATGRVYDVVYSSSSIANVPTISNQGTVQTLASATQPIGTINSDSGLNFLIGNNAATAGTRGFPGYIAEMIAWKITPSAAQLESVRRNQAVYYGLGSVVN